jgi:hypothetical protein
MEDVHGNLLPEGKLPDLKEALAGILQKRSRFQ